jgi:hypothetical protein
MTMDPDYNPTNNLKSVSRMNLFLCKLSKAPLLEDFFFFILRHAQYLHD